MVGVARLTRNLSNLGLPNSMVHSDAIFECSSNASRLRLTDGGRV